MDREELKKRLTISKEEKEKERDIVVTIKKKDLQILEGKIEKYEEALKFYAKSEEHIDPNGYGNFGEKARKALGIED